MHKNFLGAIGLLLLVIGLWLVWHNYGKQSPYEQYKQEIPHSFRLGFVSLNQEININELPIIGQMPIWLSGTLFRNGPAKFTEGSSWVSSWFDGLAMIHAFSFHGGKVSYANKFLRSDDYAFMQETGSMEYPGFVHDPCKSLFKRFLSLFIEHVPEQREYSLPNANVNIAFYGQRMVALTETPLPIECDPSTLETLGGFMYDDALPKRGIHDTAHPHYDAVHKEHIGYYTHFGRINTHNLYRIADGSTERKIIASLEVEEPSYMHSFFLTEHFAILTLLPLVVNPQDLLKKEKAFIKNFQWKPELGVKLVVVDRINNTIKEIFTAPAFFAFHTVNAFEDDKGLVLDIVTYPDGSGIGTATIETIFKGISSNNVQTRVIGEPDSDVLEAGILTRLKVDFSTHVVEMYSLFDAFIELPRINYEHYNTKPYSYVYAYGKKYAPSYIVDRLVKVDVRDGTSLEWYEDHCYPGEPVFVPAPSRNSEDDGVVLSVVLDVQKQTSFLLVLEASTFQEIARAYVPHHIPFGLHGLFKSKKE